MKFKKLLSGIYYYTRRNDNKLRASSLCGAPLYTYKGTIRSKPDQDDTWFFHLARHQCYF
jgi:hypothetical protein